MRKTFNLLVLVNRERGEVKFLNAIIKKKYISAVYASISEKLNVFKEWHANKNLKKGKIIHLQIPKNWVIPTIRKEEKQENENQQHGFKIAEIIKK